MLTLHCPRCGAPAYSRTVADTEGWSEEFGSVCRRVQTVLACDTPGCLGPASYLHDGKGERFEAGWVSADDALPVPGVRVLTCDGDDEMEAAYLDVFDGPTPSWRGDLAPATVDGTYWRPLPAPPARGA